MGCNVDKCWRSCGGVGGGARPDDCGLLTKMGVLGSSCRTAAAAALLDDTMKRSIEGGRRLDTADGEHTG